MKNNYMIILNQAMFTAKGNLRCLAYSIPIRDPMILLHILNICNFQCIWIGAALFKSWMKNYALVVALFIILDLIEYLCALAAADALHSCLHWLAVTTAAPDQA
jgi:hypothetical protein